jgi:menaquinone-dependent protoporphyrinogen IX oxidase
MPANMSQLGSEKLTDKADIVNLNESAAVDLSQYEKVIIGGSIYADRIQKYLFFLFLLQELR